MTTEFLWWRDGVIYQIYPRSFADSNGDGVGDLQGIIGKLDYLQELGVDAIWLSPINPSPDADFGYDVADYKDVDPKYGSMSDFLELVDKAHRRGIRIILDLVLNHTSEQHPWFLESRESRSNPRRDWYLWRDGSGQNRLPNKWQSVFGGNAWEYDAQTDQYYYHMFTRQQPDLNWRNPQVRAEMMDTFRFWADRGVDGFRLDVFNAYFKDDQFRDNPPRLGIRPFDWQEHIYDTNRPEMMGVVQEIRALLDAYPQRYVVGETFIATPQTAASYCGPGKLDATFEFTFLHNPFRPARFLKSVTDWEAELLPGAWPNYVLNNHDNPRSATRFRAAEDDARLKVAAALLLTLRGTPFLYYGEEIGMRDIRVKRSEIQDPVGKRYWPVPVGRDGCRSPMQWSADPGAGFSTGKPWLKLHPKFIERNVISQQKDPNSLLNFYKALLKIRKENPALQSGSFHPVTKQPGDVLVYLRETGRETIFVALNFSAKERIVQLPELSDRNWELLLSSHAGRELKYTGTGLKLAGYEAAIFRSIL